MKKEERTGAKEKEKRNKEEDEAGTTQHFSFDRLPNWAIVGVHSGSSLRQH